MHAVSGDYDTDLLDAAFNFDLPPDASRTFAPCNEPSFIDRHGVAIGVSVVLLAIVAAVLCGWPA